MNYIAHIPLIGGFALANMNVIGKPPVAITSYSPFLDNDNLLRRYLEKKEIDIPYYQLDKPAEIQDLSKFVNKLDFVSGVPPCAGLSMSGSLKAGERENSPVNDWMINSVDYVIGTLKPKVYVFENAPGLFTGVGALVRSKIEALCEKHGYAGTFYKTDSLLHGVPQRRPRTYTILVKGNQAPKLNYFNREAPSVAEFIKDIPEDATMQEMYMSKEPNIDGFEIVEFLEGKYGKDWRQVFLDTKEHLTSYDFLTRKDLLLEFKDYVESRENPNPSSIKDINHVIKKVSMGKNYRLSHRVLCIDKHHVYAVIGEMMERNVHPTENRRMNMREYMHLMGMPHDFDLFERKEFGKLPQNVPVITSEDITREVVAIINGERDFVAERFFMQDNIKYNLNKDKSRVQRLF